MAKQDDWLHLQKETPKKKLAVVELSPIDDNEFLANWLHNDNWKKGDKNALTESESGGNNGSLDDPGSKD